MSTFHQSIENWTKKESRVNLNWALSTNRSINSNLHKIFRSTSRVNINWSLFHKSIAILFFKSAHELKFFKSTVHSKFAPINPTDWQKLQTCTNYNSNFWIDSKFELSTFHKPIIIQTCRRIKLFWIYSKVQTAAFRLTDKNFKPAQIIIWIFRSTVNLNWAHIFINQAVSKFQTCTQIQVFLNLQ